MLTTVNAGQITGTAIGRLLALRKAMQDCVDLYDFISTLSEAQLEAAGLVQADAQAIQSGVADANAVAQIYLTGQPPATYPQAATAYVYANSQRAVIGPQ